MLVFILFALSGCSSTMQVLEGVDYGCADIEVDGYFTDSRATGRAIKIPEGETLTADTVEAICSTR
jgi:hypothetical protein